MAKTLNVPDEDRQFLDLLTDEERAGLEEGEDFDEDQEEGAEPEASTEEAAEQPKAEEKPEDAEPEAEEEAEEEEEAPAEPEKAEPEAEPAAEQTENVETFDFGVAPVPVSKLPDDYEERVKAIEKGKEELISKLNEGDIDLPEYHKKLDEYYREERNLERAKDRHEAAEERRYDIWKTVHVAGLLRTHPEYSSNDVLMGTLDLEVRKLQASGKYDSDTDPRILADAHANIAKALPAAFSAPQKPAPKPKAKPTEKPTAPNLARVPASDLEQPGENEFSALDRLLETDPLGWEKACEKLAAQDPAKYDRYLATQ